MNQIEHLAEETSQQSTEAVACFFLEKGQNKLKKKLLRQKEPELKDVEYSQSVHIAKNKNGVGRSCEKSTKGMA